LAFQERRRIRQKQRGLNSHNDRKSKTPPASSTSPFFFVEPALKRDIDKALSKGSDRLATVKEK